MYVCMSMYGFMQSFTLGVKITLDSDLFFQLKGVLALCKFPYCEFPYCDFSKKSINLPYV